MGYGPCRGSGSDSSRSYCPCDLSGALVMRGAVVTIAAGSKFDLVLPLAASNMVVVCVGALRGTSSVSAA